MKLIAPLDIAIHHVIIIWCMNSTTSQPFFLAAKPMASFCTDAMAVEPFGGAGAGAAEAGALWGDVIFGACQRGSDNSICVT